jgi:uncharacterized iron-regulated membrane protein
MGDSRRSRNRPRSKLRRAGSAYIVVPSPFSAWSGLAVVSSLRTSEPSTRNRWIHAPQRAPLRRALFQIHLWLGIALGVYIVVISVSGSAIVFRRELNVWLIPREVPSMEGVKLTGDALLDAAKLAYPDYEVKNVREQRRAERPLHVELERNGQPSERLFDPYTGRDMGLAYPPVLQAVEWLVDLHDNLLAGTTGRFVNGLAGGLVTALFVSGAIIWWPGRRRWRLSMTTGPPEKSLRFAWRLHSALGFWSFALLFVWAITAIYFAFPVPVEKTIDYFDADLSDGDRPGEAVLLWLIQLHFGRFGGLWIRALWALLGLVPAILFISGFVVWWTRVVRRRLAPPSPRFSTAAAERT